MIDFLYCSSAACCNGNKRKLIDVISTNTILFFKDIYEAYMVDSKCTFDATRHFLN